jgi:hypothetical protein
MLIEGVAWGQVARRGRGLIDARRAVRIAEGFVRENGYTDYVPEDISLLVPESMEFSRNRRDWLRQRHNTLRPRAVGYQKGGRNDPKGWTIGFELVNPIRENADRVGRAVTMDARGRRLTVQHMGFYLDGLEPRPD